jgi:peptidoglycan hydrolase-like protein with peptidoglycan-binding domain
MRRRARAITGWISLAVVACGLTFWAGRVTLTTPEVETGSTSEPTYRVINESIGRTLSLPVTATWESVPLATGAGSGTVTSIDVASGDVVQPGDVLYSVDLRPVTVLRGDVPAFRQMSVGLKGADVRQLQEFLRDSGYLRVRSVGGSFGDATARAVAAWQRDLGIEDDGIVRSGDVLFAREIPSRVTLAEEMLPGAQVAPGQVVARALAAEPVFTMKLTSDQVSMIPVDATVAIRSSDAEWRATIGSQTISDDGSVVAQLVPAEGDSICGSGCSGVPYGPDPAIFDSEVAIVAPAEGPAVPLSAIQTHADGTAFVVRADGEQVAVTIRTEGDGRAVVDGVAIGDEILLFGVDESGNQASESEKDT